MKTTRSQPRCTGVTRDSTPNISACNAHSLHTFVSRFSPDDSFPKLQDRFDDYLAMGVPNIWVLDPASRRSWSIAREGHFEALDGVLRTSDSHVVLAVADLFQPED